MFIDPVQLIDQTIDHLQTLAAHFEDETGATLANAAWSPEARRCKEALMTINVLIPKLRAARLEQMPRFNLRQQRLCLTCED